MICCNGYRLPIEFTVHVHVQPFYVGAPVILVPVQYTDNLMKHS